MSALAETLTPRRGPKYLGERRVVRKQLPAGLLPDPNSTLIPPTYYFGWTLDTERVVHMSKQFGITCYESDYEEESDEDDLDPNVRGSSAALGIPRNFSVLNTATAIVEQLIGGKGITIATAASDPISIVITPKGGSLALVLCDNFHYSDRPSDAAVAKVQGMFGFPDTASWMLSTSRSDWSSRKVHTRCWTFVR